MAKVKEKEAVVAPIIEELCGGPYDEPNRLKFSTWKTKLVVSCDKCKGTGFTSHEELTNYHKREWDTFTEVCKMCEGEGRLTETTAHLQVSTRYPVDDMRAKKVTRVPYSEDPIALTSHEKGVDGWLKVHAR